MTYTNIVLTVIAALLFFVWLELRNINGRIRGRFPTKGEVADFLLRNPGNASGQGR